MRKGVEASGVKGLACGGRSGEALRDGHQWWRWGSSLLLVESAAEMGAQIALLASLGFHLEPRYGTTRITLLLLLGALAGNFLDAAVLVHPSAACPLHTW